MVKCQFAAPALETLRTLHNIELPQGKVGVKSPFNERIDTHLRRAEHQIGLRTRKGNRKATWRGQDLPGAAAATLRCSHGTSATKMQTSMLRAPDKAGCGMRRAWPSTEAWLCVTQSYGVQQRVPRPPPPLRKHGRGPKKTSKTVWSAPLPPVQVPPDTQAPLLVIRHPVTPPPAHKTHRRCTLSPSSSKNAVASR